MIYKVYLMSGYCVTDCEDLEDARKKGQRMSNWIGKRADIYEFADGSIPYMMACSRKLYERYGKKIESLRPIQ